MHSAAFVSFSLALLVTHTVGFDNSAQPLAFGVSRFVINPETGLPFGVVTRPDEPKFELGGACDVEKLEICDTEFNNAMVCKSEEWQLKEKCEHESCWFYLPGFGNEASCFEPTGPETSTTRLRVGDLVASSEMNLEHVLQCSAIFSIGDNCGFDPALEGVMSCDTTCTNVGICHNGVFQLNSPCSPGHCQWRGEIGQPFCVSS